jgi:hypothetical protein
LSFTFQKIDNGNYNSKDENNNKRAKPNPSTHAPAPRITVHHMTALALIAATY